jgi:hypothetical protein
VYPSPDGADVAAPISLFEWLLNFYEEARESKVRFAACSALFAELGSEDELPISRILPCAALQYFFSGGIASSVVAAGACCSTRRWRPSWDLACCCTCRSASDVAVGLLLLLLLQHPPLETITGPGELLYVPRGWWHMVLNLDHAVAVTQNYVSSVGLPAVLAFLKQGSQQLVSGCCLQDRCGTTLQLQCSQVLLQCLPVMQISCVCHVMMCTA